MSLNKKIQQIIKSSSTPLRAAEISQQIFGVASGKKLKLCVVQLTRLYNDRKINRKVIVSKCAVFSWNHHFVDTSKKRGKGPAAGYAEDLSATYLAPPGSYSIYAKMI